uniref:CSON000934 protein n=1 Tax=Culicoides sonorensis TaxID=179676 RepID=A0A336KYI6_CULSO
MDFINALPKIELHAHLNGSLSNSTLLKLRKLKYGDSEATDIEPAFYQILESDNLSLTDCFLKFKYAHNLTDSWDALKLATECMIEDFAREKTVYLEIRINRADGPEAAKENLDVTLKLMQKYPDIIKGMDLSGDPLKYTFRDFISVFTEARNSGLGIALHAAEVQEKYEDVTDILEFGPDRIGHGTFIEESGIKNWQTLVSKKIPIECCLTSNVKCGTVKNYDDHHFKKLFEMGHPVTICTDDFGVFGTSLSQEIYLSASHHKISNIDLVKIMKQSVDCSFASDTEKKALKEIFDKFCIENNFHLM